MNLVRRLGCGDTLVEPLRGHRGGRIFLVARRLDPTSAVYAALKSRHLLCDSDDSVAFDLRWNWNTPFIISAHNPQVLYFGGVERDQLRARLRGGQLDDALAALDLALTGDEVAALEAAYQPHPVVGLD